MRAEQPLNGGIVRLGPEIFNHPQRGTLTSHPTVARFSSPMSYRLDSQQTIAKPKDSFAGVVCAWNDAVMP